MSTVTVSQPERPQIVFDAPAEEAMFFDAGPAAMEDEDQGDDRSPSAVAGVCPVLDPLH